MSTAVSSPIKVILQFLQNGPLWIIIADIFAVLAALSLPWSASLLAIFVLCWLGALALVMDYRDYVRSLKRPACFLPFALILLAMVGTLWSDALWAERIHAIAPTVKLIVLPALFYHFTRSTRGMWVLIAFLTSCTVLMLLSWVVLYYPELTLKPLGPQTRGIFVKNYIAQSQEFSLCAVALIYPIIGFLRANRVWQTAFLGALALSFVVNMAFVNVSRTTLVTMPIMLAMFALLHLRRRTSVIIFCVMVVVMGLAWTVSPQLQRTTETFVSDYTQYKAANTKTSIGLRLEYWKKSLRFFVEAPVIGHGTGSTRGLFERAAIGNENAASGAVINNPHNQTLNVAVQWGVVGIAVLYAMWFFHLQLFRGQGFAAWIGLLVVVQNIFTSLFNSHIFDFHEGWMYVLGVGIAGGMALRSGQPGEQNT